MDPARQKELEEAMRRFGDAWARGDERELDSLLSPNYVHTDVTGALLSRDKWLAYVRRRNGRTTRLELLDLQFNEITTDVVVVTGANKITGSGAMSPEDTNDLAIRFTQIWARTDARWLREAFQATRVTAKTAS